MQQFGESLRMVSEPGRQAIHAYYDLCPESPDGEDAVYFAWDGPAPGPGEVMVRPVGGGVARRAGRVNGEGELHAAARQQWTAAGEVAWCDTDGQGRLRTLIADREGRQLSRFDDGLRMAHPTLPIGLAIAHDSRPVPTPEHDAVLLMRLDREATEPLFSLADAMALHPLGRDFEGAAHLILMHAKWSPDGSHFMVMASNTAPLARRNLPGHPVHAMFVARADGSGLRYLAEEDHHTIWDADSRHLLSFRRRADRGQDLVRYQIDTATPSIALADLAGKHAIPSWDGRWLLADVNHTPQKGEGGVVIYDLVTGARETLAAYLTPDPSQRGVHAHPVFGRGAKRVYFNAAEDGFRRVYALSLPERFHSPPTPAIQESVQWVPDASRSR